MAYVETLQLISQNAFHSSLVGQGRREQSFVNRPLIIQSQRKSGHLDPNLFSPRREGLCFPLISNKAASAFNWLIAAMKWFMFLSIGNTRDGEGVDNVPTLFQSLVNKTSVNAKTGTPLLDIKGLAPKSYHFIAAPIVGLLCFSSPFAVIRRVAFIVVNAVNGVLFRRLLANVQDEKFKRVLPSLTNLNAAFPVAFIRRVQRVVASLKHSIPRSIQRVSFVHLLNIPQTV